MRDIGRIARRDRLWVAGLLLVAAPAGFGMGQWYGWSWPGAAQVAAAAAIALALAFVVIREMTDGTIKTEAQAVRALGLEVLAAVPRLRTAAERRAQRRVMIGMCVTAAVAAAAVAAAQWLG